MKKFFIISVILALFGLTSCQKDEAKAIIGSWRATSVEMDMGGMNMEMDLSESGIQIDVLFKADGTGTVSGTAEGESISSDFEYSVSDDMLSLLIEDETVSVPIEINGKKMSMKVDGDIFESPAAQVTVNFTKK